jgi:hypothetical protein
LQTFDTAHERRTPMRLPRTFFKGQASMGVTGVRVAADYLITVGADGRVLLRRIVHQSATLAHQPSARLK